MSCRTINRELRRKCDLRSGKYVMDLAQRKADERKRNKRRKQVFNDTKKEKCRELLSKYYSPEQITGRCKLDGVEIVSQEVVYRWIWDDKRKGGVYIPIFADKAGSMLNVVLRMQVEV